MYKPTLQVPILVQAFC